jgi:hypothetical protein
MRRKAKRGVYTNRTIKQCPCCEVFCVQCKGPCKIQFEKLADPETIDPEHLTGGWRNISSKLHRAGIGKIKTNCKFVFYSEHNHRHPRRLQSPWRMLEEKKQIFYDLNDDLEEYQFEVSLEKQIKRKMIEV